MISGKQPGPVTSIEKYLPAVIIPRCMRIPEAAKYISATIWQVESLLRDGTIPSFILGKRRVVDRLELDKFIDRRNAEAKAQAEAIPTANHRAAA
jgi:hypothetical protein